ncbi:hypothetical protein KIW84_020588 [Lathyrus oleraceus]|uniref:Uncharacterized protein n=1 Tax=Pisum sativum TaxID=3888 RepID=A0A9D4YA07_PEA|nr:hypothetical protein KIW84_020586 [Pisum sativum]KAI5433365.1 hypothetical protein KIW84_020588 [Pisum sativum]
MRVICISPVSENNSVKEEAKELFHDGLERGYGRSFGAIYKGMNNYAWGLLQISKVVSFLNNDCKLVHGNVFLASVVATQTLDWKLHAFDVLSEFDGSNESPSTQVPQYALACRNSIQSNGIGKI